MRNLLCLIFLLPYCIGCNQPSSQPSNGKCDSLLTYFKEPVYTCLSKDHTITYTAEELDTLSVNYRITRYLPALQSKPFDMYEYNTRLRSNNLYHILLKKDEEKIWLECENIPKTEDQHGGNFWGDWYTVYKVMFTDSTAIYSHQPAVSDMMGTPLHMLISGGMIVDNFVFSVTPPGTTPAPSEVYAAEGLYDKMLTTPVSHIDVYYYDNLKDYNAHTAGAELQMSTLHIDSVSSHKLLEYLNCTSNTPVPQK